MARSLGTYLSLAGTPLARMEKLFAVVAYVPKATVQAGIGAAPSRRRLRRTGRLAVDRVGTGRSEGIETFRWSFMGTFLSFYGLAMTAIGEWTNHCKVEAD